MIAEIINIGTELLLGDVVNTNATFLAKELHLLGIDLYYMTTVGDNHKRLIQQLQLAYDRSDIIILTGGLGPTLDDMTKEGVAQFLNLDLVLSPKAQAVTEQYFHKRNLDISPLNQRQYYVPQGSLILDNPNGTACGLIIETNHHSLILLPGPPNELIPMFKDYVTSYLKDKNSQVFQTKDYRLRGIGESKVAQSLKDLIENQNNPTLATYASVGEVHLRLMVSGNIKEEIEKYEAYQKVIESRLSNYIFTKTNENFLDILIKIIQEKGWTISFAESCTGGLLAAKWIEKPGVSSIIKESYITYSNEAKHRILGVLETTLKDYGAVSDEVAREMAAGVAKVAHSNIGLSITGIAGPEGGTKEKPVGLVYIGCYINNKIISKKLQLIGNRPRIQEGAIAEILTLLWTELKK